MDIKSYQTAMDDAGKLGDSVDMENLVRVVEEELCDMDEDQWAIYLSLAEADPERDRISVEYVCPDRLAKFEGGREQLGASVDTVNQACETDRNDRTESQSRLVEAVGCD